MINDRHHVTRTLRLRGYGDIGQERGGIIQHRLHQRVLLKTRRAQQVVCRLFDDFVRESRTATGAEMRGHGLDSRLTELMAPIQRSIQIEAAPTAKTPPGPRRQHASRDGQSAQPRDQCVTSGRMHQHHCRATRSSPTTSPLAMLGMISNPTRWPCRSPAPVGNV